MNLSSSYGSLDWMVNHYQLLVHIGIHGPPGSLGPYSMQSHENWQPDHNELRMDYWWTKNHFIFVTTYGYPSKIHNLDRTLIPINISYLLEYSQTTGNQFYSWLTNEKEGFIVLRMQLKISLGYNFREIRNYNFISYQWVWNELVNIIFSRKFYREL